MATMTALASGAVSVRLARRFGWLVGLWMFAVLALPAAQAQDAATLMARHAALRDVLAVNPFKRPLYLASTESSSDLKGDIHAVIAQPFAVVGKALRPVDHWCDILILHLNVKQCRTGARTAAQTSPTSPAQPSAGAAGATLRLNIGRKSDQPVHEAYPFEFAYTVLSAQPDYLQVALDAENGPLGTSRYRIVLEVVALDADHSFVHLSYAYAFGVTARVAMQAYLATAGRDKVGFSVFGTQADGRPAYIGGTRGVVERNTMRYFLAIESYLGALSVPPQQQLDKRLNAWHSGVERYPVQLRELERAEYLDMKRREVERQRAPLG